MNRLRVTINLLTFLGVTLLLAWWAVTNHITFGLTSPASDALTVEFAELPGLQPGSEVAYLGHGVGSVEAVELTPDAVDVVTAIDPAVELPSELTATVRRRSALGEPYIELAPVAGTDVDGERLAPDARIPRSRTTPPVSYEELLGSVAALLEQVPVEAIGTVVEELSIVLDGREGTILEAIADTDAVLSQVATEAPMLDRLATESTAMAALVAELAPTFGAATDDLQRLVAEIHGARGELFAAMDRAPALLDTIADITIEMRPPLGCLLGTLDRSLTVLDTPANAERIGQVVSRAPSLIGMLQDVTHDRDGGPWLRVDVIFNSGVEPVRQYAAPRAVPGVQPTTDCDPQGYEGPAGIGVGSRSAIDDLGPPRLDRGEHPDPGRAPDDDQAPAASAPTEPGGSEGPNWMVLAAAALAVLLALAAITLARRAGGTP